MDPDRPRLGRRPGTFGGFFYALLPALALLWMRERDAHGLDLLIWAFLVTWSTDIGAYFVGRASASASSRRRSAPARRSKGFTAESPRRR
jgi:phosphatidate cytidylyltransferase